MQASQPDPSGLAGGWSPFEYVLNDPLSMIDDDGYEPKKIYPEVQLASPLGFRDRGGLVQEIPLAGAGKGGGGARAAMPNCPPSPSGASTAAGTTFKTAHYASRLESAGVNVARAEAAVAREISAMRGNLAPDADVVGRLTVDGVKLEYRARLLESGTANIGTLFPVK